MIFVVEMLRNDDREEHSYIDGVYDDEYLALKAAWSHMECRGGKYGAEVHGYKGFGGDRVYFRKLDSDVAFAADLKKTAEAIRKLIEVDATQAPDDVPRGDK